MSIIIKRIHCFCIYSIENQRGKSDKNDRQEVLKERIKQNNMGHQTIGHMDSFTGNESIVNPRKKENQYTEKFPYSRFLL